ncbi:MAG: glucose/arabinose dehydrogenase/PKD repeat protein [Chlamydiales bacterium]|jgi:glucose/arabinose dehydrogenase/PKD repeat protein
MVVMIPIPTRPGRGGALALSVAMLVLAQLALSAPATVAPHEGEETLPVFFELTPLSGGLDFPTGMTFTPTGAILIAERAGRVLYHDGLALQSTPLIDLTDEINENGDRGLLAIAAHPGFVPDNGATSWIYLLYTVSPILGQELGFDEDDRYSFSRLTRYRVDTVAGTLAADLSSRTVLLGHQLPDGSVPDAIASLHTSHSNGSLLFADDGSLLLSTGDGAHFNFTDTGGSDPAGFDNFIHPVTTLRGPTPIDQDSGVFRSQDLRSLAGKILRVNPGTGFGYASNPFYDGDASSNPSRVFALGLRNPFRFSIIPGTGSMDSADGDPNTLVIGDVGWEKVEELNLCRGGENFGWPCREGAAVEPTYGSYQRPANPYNYPDCQSTPAGLQTDPLVSWAHQDASALFPPGIHTDVNGTPQSGFRGTCAIGGATYLAGGSYPAQYEGRYFFVDYSDQWLKTLELDAQGTPTAIQDFGEGLGPIVSVMRNPANGDLYCLALADPTHAEGRVLWLRYDTNATPVAVASATPLAGDTPLTVDFDGSASFDPNVDPLDFLWDFADQSPNSTDAVTSHTFTSAGIFDVTLTVTDPGGRSSSDSLTIAVGEFPPSATIQKPTRGLAFDQDEVIQLKGSGTDTVPGTLTYSWKIDLLHNGHMHPAFYQATGSNTSFTVESHGSSGELFYFQVHLTVTDESGLSGTDSTFIYPRSNLTDVAETWTPISRVADLQPPGPSGLGNLDIEVMRDGDYPRAGQNALERQYDTFHAGAQGTDDWFGYESPAAIGTELRFVSISFVEGHNQRRGGWFEDLDVEVRVEGIWESVEGLTIAPDYPFAFAAQEFFNGVSFERYELSFEPSFGDAIRLRGTPGGENKFLSAAELRCLAVQVVPAGEPVEDVTRQGKVVARVFELSPPNPTGNGNSDPETIRNRTRPSAGTTSPLAQYDTSHGGDQGNQDWIGYTFKTERTFARLIFQEGLEDASGGSLANLEVQVLPTAGGTWQAVAGLVSTPPYPGSAGTGYETFQLDFTPVVGVGIRIFGVPQGSTGFLSVAELRVLASVDPGMIWSNYCYCTVGPCDNLNPFAGCVHSDGEGARMVVAGGSTSVTADDLVLQTVGIPPGKFGLVFVGTSQIQPPFGDGRRCVGSVQGRRPVRQTDAWGRLTETTGLVQWAQTHGQIQAGSSYNFQAWFRDPPGPCGSGFNLSNGLSVTFGP